MRTIKTVDVSDPAGPKTAEHEVVVVGQSRTGFQFKSANFPPPKLGLKFYADDREIDVVEGRMKVEEGKAVFYFSATFV